LGTVPYQVAEKEGNLNLTLKQERWPNPDGGLSEKKKGVKRAIHQKMTSGLQCPDNQAQKRGKTSHTEKRRLWEKAIILGNRKKKAPMSSGKRGQTLTPGPHTKLSNSKEGKGRGRGIGTRKKRECREKGDSLSRGPGRKDATFAPTEGMVGLNVGGEKSLFNWFG